MTTTMMVSCNTGYDGADDWRNSTDVVESALEHLKNLVNHKLASPIVSIERPSAHSPLGKRRVKFVVTLENGNAIALQVLNSHRAMQKFRGWAKKCRSLIFAIFVPEVTVSRTDNFRDHVLDVANRLRETIRQAVVIFKRKIDSLVHHYRIRGRDVTFTDVSELINRRGEAPMFCMRHRARMCH